MTFSVPSCFAAAISAVIPPPAAADVATDQLTGFDGVGLADAEDDGRPAEDECLADGELAGEDEHPASIKATATVPTKRCLRPTSLLFPPEHHSVMRADYVHSGFRCGSKQPVVVADHAVKLARQQSRGGEMNRVARAKPAIGFIHRSLYYFIINRDIRENNQQLAGVGKQG
jgi:hypothetical protein